jgi:hypothetical protein
MVLSERGAVHGELAVFPLAARARWRELLTNPFPIRDTLLDSVMSGTRECPWGVWSHVPAVRGDTDAAVPSCCGDPEPTPWSRRVGDITSIEIVVE